MGPVTHAEWVVNLIERFIERQPEGILVHQLRRSRLGRTSSDSTQPEETPYT
jgi:hypothetical protein